MRRIRVALGLLSLAVVVPLGLLAWRALEGAAVERAVRHQAVAERLFDEMERALSEFLAREEARPFEAYRFYVAAPGDRSPLARPDALEPFVIGAFQIDPDGSLHTPMQPRDPAEATARGDWPPPETVARAIARVRGVVAAAWPRGAVLADERAAASKRAAPAPGRIAAEPAAPHAPREREDAGRPQLRSLGYAAAPPGPPLPPSQAPGTTRPFAVPLEQGLAREERAPAPEAYDAGSAYDVLQRLNRGAEARAERRPKLAKSVAPLAGEPLAEADAAGADEGLPVALDPMVGRPGRGDTLLLYRTVVVGTRGYRQGLVLDRRALGAWLETRVLGAEGVAGTRVSFDGPPPAPGGEGEDFGFQHRFAEPFDALGAWLRLAPLPGVGRPGAVYAVLGIGLAVGLAGLLALQRMVAVVVEYAERRSRFVAAVTHELRTPLTAIRMYGEMLRDGLVGSESRRQACYDTITDESERLTRLIDNVLAFSRLEHGRQEMRLRAGDVGPLLEDAAQRLATHAASEGVALEVHVEPGLPSVCFDRDALLQVLYNLVDNAMKYGTRGGARRVVLEATRQDGRVRVAVRDFGPGVAPRHLSHLFEPFYRAESEVTSETRGTGIGLALVKDLAERMGASVRGGNAEGGGFRVGLVFAPAEGGR